MTSSPQTSPRRRTSALAAVIATFFASTAVNAAPGIRTAPGNSVPTCVTPERLMAFVAERNPKLDPRYKDIARWYQYWGDAWHVRWDYAFYQMILETNYLMYRRGNGDRGDVHEKQNNFAGIGATGGGVAGEKFPDVKTGVLAQIEHLVAYSGEKLAKPVAKRTFENQDDIIAKSRRLGRAVTFGDLARRWATDRQYARSIDTVSELFRKSQCSGATVTAEKANFVVPAPQPAKRPALRSFAPPSLLGGPKPQKLAGPEAAANPKAAETAETEPGRTPKTPRTKAKATEPPSARAAPSEKSGPEKHNSPVRTIWSRDGASEPLPPQAATPIVAAPQAAVAPPPQSGEVPIVRAPPAAPHATAPALPAPSPAAEEALSLPQFKIKPIEAPPLRLGGPREPIAPPPGTQVSLIAEVPKPRQPDLAPGQRMSLAGPVPPAELVAPAANTACRVLSASYGGTKTLLVKSSANGVLQLTALTVIDGFEKTLFETYAKASAPNAEIVGEYASKDAALAEARANCGG